MSTWVEGPLVVPLDGRAESVRAVPIAGRISRRLSSGMRLISAVSEASETEARSTWISEAAARHLGEDQFSIQVAVGDDIVETITSAAAEDGLVCMATAGSVRFHGGHWGSVAEGVARALGRPMLMIGPNVDPVPGESTRRVIVPLDGSPLAEAALQPAADLATVLGEPLWLIAVVSPMAQAAEAASHSGTVGHPEEGYLATTADRIGAASNVEVRHETIQSENIDRAIVDFAGDDGTAVMSTHGRSGLSRLFAGSVAAGVVAHSHRAVVVVRPAAG